MYSHRSTVLHAFAACAADGMGLSARDAFLVVVPLFHANAWSLPFSAAMCGAKMVLPGPNLDPESLYMLLEHEQCTKAAGIPTIWLNFLAWVEANRERLDLKRLKLKQVLSGGSAPPRATIEKFRDLLGVYLLHAWGMTETSPIVTTGTPLAKHEDLSPSEIVKMQVKQGRQVFGVDRPRRPRLFWSVGDGHAPAPSQQAARHGDDGGEDPRALAQSTPSAKARFLALPARSREAKLLSSGSSDVGPPYRRCS